MFQIEFFWWTKLLVLELICCILRFLNYIVQNVHMKFILWTVITVCVRYLPTNRIKHEMKVLLNTSTKSILELDLPIVLQLIKRRSISWSSKLPLIWCPVDYIEQSTSFRSFFVILVYIFKKIPWLITYFTTFLFTDIQVG